MNTNPTLSFLSILIATILFSIPVMAQVPQGNGNGLGINNGQGTWGLQGNNNSQGNWLGTADSTDLILKSFGQERLRLKADGGLMANGLLRAERLTVAGLTELDSVRTVHIRANRISSQNPGDTLIFFGDNSIVMDHSNDHIYAVHTNGTKDMRIQCQGFLEQGQSGNNHTMFNSTRGNVGIGVGNYGTLPTEKLHVNGNVRITGSRLHVSSSGDIGIGTNSPQARLDVRNSSNAYALRIQSDGKVIAGQLSGSGSTARVHFGDANHYIGSAFGKGLSIGTYNAADAIVIQEGTGKVGINVGGSHNFGEGMLEVNGTIRSTKVVTETSGWPDYVFKDDYRPMEICELRSFIKENNRLPDIPSAEEIETNGLDLGELVKLQMKKIEELTLYVLDLEETVRDIKEEIQR